jgi:hypothetical protein
MDKRELTLILVVLFPELNCSRRAFSLSLSLSLSLSKKPLRQRTKTIKPLDY